MRGGNRQPVERGARGERADLNGRPQFANILSIRRACLPFFYQKVCSRITISYFSAAARRIIGVLAFFILLFLTGAVFGRTLLVDESDQTIWVMVSPPQDDGQTAQSMVFSRPLGNLNWQLMYQIAAPVRAMTHQDGEAAILLENGQWMFVYQGGRSLGSSVPGNGELVQIAGNKDHLFGLAWVPGGLATMRASTQLAKKVIHAAAPQEKNESVATTAPTAQSRLVLMRYALGAWTGVAEINAVPPKAAVSLGSANGKVTVAYQTGTRQLQVVNWSAEHGLEPLKPIHASFDIAQFKVFFPAGRLTIWTAPDAGAGSLYRWNGGWSNPVVLSETTDLSKPGARDIAAGNKEIRFVYAKADQWYVQQYRLDGAANGAPVQILSQDDQTQTTESRWVSIAVIALLVFVMLSAFRRQDAIAETMQNRAQLHIAPLGRRLAAGLIDLSPYIIAVIVVSSKIGRYERLTDAMNNPSVQDPLLITMGIYLLHTFLGELFFARSIGKYVIGLKVTDLHGEKPTTLAVFLRNLLRLIDLFVLFLPIVISPLRQRIGDLAGGTLVVLSKPPVPVETETPGAASGSN